jgi:hypothetical protein
LRKKCEKTAVVSKQFDSYYKCTYAGHKSHKTQKSRKPHSGYCLFSMALDENWHFITARQLSLNSYLCGRLIKS